MLLFFAGSMSHLSKYATGGHADGHVGHTPSEKRTYCERRVISSILYDRQKLKKRAVQWVVM